MFDRDSIYNVIDSHFVKHLLRPSENPAAIDAALAAEVESVADGTAEPVPEIDVPDNMLDDLLDELDGALEELQGDFDGSLKALTAAAIGFVDGVVAQSNGSYTTYEDEYVEDAKNCTFAAIDKAITGFSAGFDGSRDWGEAAMGYIRRAAKNDGDVPAELDEEACRAQAQGFIYGADTCEDYEWKVIQVGEGSVLITDEEAIEEFHMQKLDDSSPGGLFGKVFDALGIDLKELEEAFAETAEGESEEGGFEQR